MRVTAVRVSPNLFRMRDGLCLRNRLLPCVLFRKPDHVANRRKDMRPKLSSSPVVVRSMAWDPAHPSREVLLNREWLVTNGLGGYASGTVSGAVTRKYHGILVAALPAPLGRVVMWNHVSEFLRFDDGDLISLGAEERAGGQLDLKGAEYLREFRLEDGMPVWIYHVRDLAIEKRISMPHLQNTVHVSYQISGDAKPPRLEL